MTNRDDDRITTRILAPKSTAERVSRRLFMKGGAIALFSGSVLLAACGSDSDGGTGGDAPSATTGGGGVPTDLEDQLNFYHWAEYDDPKLFKQFTDEFGPSTQIDIYASNEEMIQKLNAAQGTSGYDIVVPTGVYIPQMVSLGLLAEMDLGKIPNFSNIEKQYTNQPWDPNNAHSVCKDWGSTGWMWDTEAIDGDIATWSDFIAAAAGSSQREHVRPRHAGQPLSASTSGPTASTGRRLTPPTWMPVRSSLVNELAPHVKAFDSYPGIALTEGKYALSQAWNGDARQGFLAVEDKDPERYKWALGAPKTELWMDNWCILAEAENVERRVRMDQLRPRSGDLHLDLAFHGYNTGIKGVEEKAETAGLTYLDMVFFDEAQVATMEAGAVNDATERLIQIWDDAKAKAGA